MTVFLIRHGQTRGNLERRYIGSTDQRLCARGREALEAVRPPAADALYVSPMLRCRETAAILYPGMEQTVVPGLQETDMGAFEGHTYAELKDDIFYQAWLESSGDIAPPGGERKEEVRIRVLEAFRSVAARHGPEDAAAMVVHGGTIMTLLEAVEPSHEYCRWQAPNGGGFRCAWDGTEMKVEGEL